MNKIIY